MSHEPTRRLRRLLRRPSLHFSALGLAAFTAQSVCFPAPKPVVGPLSDERVEAMRRAYESQTGHAPSVEQEAELVAEELDRDLLFRHGIEQELHDDDFVRSRLVRNMRFMGIDGGRTDDELVREALSLGLHLGDEIIRRHVINKTEEHLSSDRPIGTPTLDELRATFGRRDDLDRPPRYTISHVFFPPARVGEVDGAMRAIDREAWAPDDTVSMGASFPGGRRFERGAPDDLARFFGREFVDGLQAMPLQPGRWHGPVPSRFGVHLVWVEAVEPARPSTFEEVEAQLRSEWRQARRREHLREALDALRRAYEVRS